MIVKITNLYDRQNYETEYEPLAQKYSLGVITYYSLASGFLTGKYDFSKPVEGKRADTIKQYINNRGKNIIAALKEVANQAQATPAQIALAWILARPSITAPIASVSKTSQFDILKNVELKLTNQMLDKLNQASKY